MKLDQKYFNTFLAVVAVLAAATIAYFTISSQGEKQAAFKQRMMQQDSLKTVSFPRVEQSDSLSITDFSDQYILLQFWTNWSDGAVAEHRKLMEFQKEHSNKLTIVAAIVGLQKEEALSYIKQHDFPFQYVAGSPEFGAFGVPGLPAYLLYNLNQELIYISLGELNKAQTDSLRRVIESGR